MNILLIDWLLNDFSGAEWDISWWIKVSWHLSQGAESCSVGFDLSDLEIRNKNTLESFSTSTTLTILPNDGMTLILMLLKMSINLTRQDLQCFGMTWFFNLWYFIFIFIVLSQLNSFFNLMLLYFKNLWRTIVLK